MSGERYSYCLAGLPDALFAEVSELMPPWIPGAVSALPVEDIGSPGCSDVTDCSSDWSTRVAMVSTGSLWVAWLPVVGEVGLGFS